MSLDEKPYDTAHSNQTFNYYPPVKPEDDKEN